MIHLCGNALLKNYALAFNLMDGEEYKIFNITISPPHPPFIQPFSISKNKIFMYDTVCKNDLQLDNSNVKQYYKNFIPE